MVTIQHGCLRNFAPVDHHIVIPGPTKDGLEKTEMNVTKAQEKSSAHQTQQQQSSQSPAASLNDRYGKIGISAVAGACQHKGEKRAARESRFIPGDSD
jgi:hypothetical protein